MTLDGQSGVGKSTMIDLLGERLRRLGHQVLPTRTPSPSALGSMARDGTFEFRGLELSLLVAADRYHHERTVVRSALADGTIVICDRYVASSIVLDQADGVPAELLRSVYAQLPMADLSIILYGEPALCARRASARGHYSRFHSTDVLANQRERDAFLRAATELRRRGQPVLTHHIGGHAADVVAAHLSDAIRAVARRSA
ncbi:dTMP kinase [Actinoplanes sp. NPDC051851]|uniref:dTMP kinase n=1 Tax=Actinoplanes sp. NPDC051851 TaxID=3154753 RepID=UPI003427C398